MRTLVHLSDLHFGRVDAALLDPLRNLVREIDPDVTVMAPPLRYRSLPGALEVLVPGAPAAAQDHKL